MSALPKSTAAMTVASFLDWSERQADDRRYELLDGVVHAMSPERLVHVQTKYAVARELDRGIVDASLQCDTLIDGMAVRVDDQTVFEPDVLVRCGPPLPGDTVLILDPAIVVEVASPSTQRVDAITKLARYFRNPTIMHYLIVLPTERTVVHHRRTSAGIEATILTTGSLRLDPPGLAFDLDAVFPPAADNSA